MLVLAWVGPPFFLQPPVAMGASASWLNSLDNELVLEDNSRAVGHSRMNHDLQREVNLCIR